GYDADRKASRSCRIWCGHSPVGAPFGRIAQERSARGLHMEHRTLVAPARPIACAFVLALATTMLVAPSVLAQTPAPKAPAAQPKAKAPPAAQPQPKGAPAA